MIKGVCQGLSILNLYDLISGKEICDQYSLMCIVSIQTLPVMTCDEIVMGVTNLSHGSCNPRHPANGFYPIQRCRDYKCKPILFN